MYQVTINIAVNENLYLKDPQSSDLGQKIIRYGVEMIAEMGLEQFTFRKLSKVINSTEASVYRYFENKHRLFVYLLNWYWEWLSARIELNTMNITEPQQRLKILLGVIVDSSNRNSDTPFVDEELLHKIVIEEGTKAYHHKAVDADNQEGFFTAYKNLAEKTAAIISEINPAFPYPRSLATALIETANNNIYNARHLPRLTDIKDEDSAEILSEKVKKLLEFMCFGLIEKCG